MKLAEQRGVIEYMFGWLFRHRKSKRLELRYVSYADANKLFNESPGEWRTAEEEDDNPRLGWVYMERLER